MTPWWCLEDPTVNGPDDEPESTSDDRCTCDVCGDTYEVWTDPTDQRPVTWCCETCWAKGAENELHAEANRIDDERRYLESA